MIQWLPHVLYDTASFPGGGYGADLRYFQNPGGRSFAQTNHWSAGQFTWPRMMRVDGIALSCSRPIDESRSWLQFRVGEDTVWRSPLANLRGSALHRKPRYEFDLARDVMGAVIPPLPAPPKTMDDQFWAMNLAHEWPWYIPWAQNFSVQLDAAAAEDARATEPIETRVELHGFKLTGPSW